MKPEVRIIQDQSIETNEVEATSSEIASLLSKYGYGETNHENIQNKNNETFEEMMKSQKPKPKKINNPFTFDPGSVATSYEKYGELDNGYGFKLNIVSDMKL